MFFAETRIYAKYGKDKLYYKCYFSKYEIYEGEYVEFVEELRNMKWLPIPWLKAELTTSKWLDFAETQSIVTDKSRFVSSYFLMRGYTKVKRVWKVKALKRGVFEIENAALVLSDIFGSVHLSKQADNYNTSVRVLPAPVSIQNMDENSPNLIGEIIAERNLLKDVFFINGIREYTGFEPMNHISWKHSANQQKLMVFENDFTVGKNVMIIFNSQCVPNDFRNVSNDTLAEKNLKVCASVAKDISDSNIPVGIISNCGSDGEPLFINEAFGLEHSMKILRTFSEINTNPLMPIEFLLNEYCNNLTSSDIIIVTPYLDDVIDRFACENRGVKVAVTSGVSNEFYERPYKVYSQNGGEPL